MKRFIVFVLLALTGFSVNTATATQADGVFPPSKSLVFNKQDLEFNYHYKLADDTVVFLGGAAGETKKGRSIRVPLIVRWDLKQDLFEGSVFAQKENFFVRDESNIKPQLGFHRPWLVRDQFIVTAEMDWEVDGKVAHTDQKNYLAVFDGDFSNISFYEFIDGETKERHTVSPFAQTNDGRLLAAGYKKSVAMPFITFLDEGLEPTKSLFFPKECLGRKIYSKATQEIVVFNSQEGSLCFISLQTQEVTKRKIKEDFLISSVAVDTKGNIIISGQHRRKRENRYGWQLETDRVLKFNTEREFTKGIEFSQFIDNHGSDIFFQPESGYILSVILRLSGVSLQTNTALIKLSSELDVLWGRKVWETTGNSVRSIINDDDGTVNILLLQEKLPLSKTEIMLGQEYRVHSTIAERSATLLLTLNGDGSENGDQSEPLKTDIRYLMREEGNIFLETLKLPYAFTEELVLKKRQVFLQETNITLENKELTRPWRDK
jgi:hypothetical protein